jgi:hypothetical protein
MNNESHTPPTLFDGCLFAVLYILGILVGLVIGAISLFSLVNGNTSGGAPHFGLEAIVCFVSGAVIIVAIVGLFRRGDLRSRPFIAGFLTGICLAALLCGFCFSLLGSGGIGH